ncbi:hypothetical protein LTR53_019444, partial [Teratosphaeriaceae sp. CCFEE 6253]
MNHAGCLHNKEVTYSKRRKVNPGLSVLDDRDMAFSPPNINYNAPPTVPPRPARSQKEAMASMQPYPSDVEQVVSITGVDGKTAERYLR